MPIDTAAVMYAQAATHIAGYFTTSCFALHEQHPLSLDFVCCGLLHPLGLQAVRSSPGAYEASGFPFSICVYTCICSQSRSESMILWGM